MKKTLLVLVAGLMTGAIAQEEEMRPTMPKRPIRINVNGSRIETPLVNPTLIDGRVMVPLRGVLQEFDAKIEWFPVQKVVVAKGHGRSVTLPLGAQYAIVGDKVVALEVPARIQNGRTLVPLRFVAEALNAYVVWEESERTVVITSRIDSGDN